MPRRLSEAKRQFRATLREALVAQFPNCFRPKGSTDKKPLKIGIREDLIARFPDMDPKLIKDALADYSGPTYRARFFCGTPRIDLDGNEVGHVSAQEAKHAGECLMDMGLVEEALAIARSLPQEELVAA